MNGEAEERGDKKTKEDEGEDEWVPHELVHHVAWWALEVKVPVIS